MSMPAVLRSRCINCSLLIPKNHQAHSLQQASTRIITILQSWISPTELSSESVLCAECMALLQDRANSSPDGASALPSPAFGHRSICFSCGISTLRASRTCILRSDRPERNIILLNVSPHLVSRLERVCAACWVAAHREARRLVRHDTSRRALPDAGTGGDTPAPPPSPQQPSRPSRARDSFSTKDNKPWQPTENTRICSAHLVGGKQSYTENSPAYVPTIVPAVYKKKELPQSTLARHERLLKRKQGMDTSTASKPQEETEKKKANKNIEMGSNISPKEAGSRSIACQTDACDYEEENVSGSTFWSWNNDRNEASTQTDIYITKPYEIEQIILEDVKIESFDYD